MVKITYKVGDKVFAKVKGYPPWPAKIVGESGKKFKVIFYGTKETGAIKPEELSYYLKYKDSYVAKHTNRVGYGDAVKEIEKEIEAAGGTDGNVGGNDAVASDTSVSSNSDKKSVKKTTLRKRKVPASESETEETPETPASKKSRTKSNTSIASSTDDNSVTPSVKSKRSSSASSPEKSEAEPADPVVEKVANSDTEQTIEAETTKDEETTDKGNSDKEKDVEEDEHEKKDDSTNEKSTDKERTEKEQSPKKQEKTANKGEESIQKCNEKIELISEEVLKNHLLYVEHVKANQDLYKDKPVDYAVLKHTKNDVFPVKLSFGICGIKIHKKWPLELENEYERAIYDEQCAKSILELKEQLVQGQKIIRDITEYDVLSDIGMSTEELKEHFLAIDIESKRQRMNRLRKEADLVSWDSKMKNNLGIDKAKPDTAIEILKTFESLRKEVDALMFVKHPHVVDSIRRLRRYVGNVSDWDMSGEDLDTFAVQAEEIRSIAENIFEKITAIMHLENSEKFWDLFMAKITEFRNKCKDMTEDEVLLVCADPDSREAFLHKIDLEEIVKTDKKSKKEST